MRSQSHFCFSVGRAACFVFIYVWVAGSLPAREPWVVLQNCRLVANESNDADSFHVKAAGREFIFRLYFVDAPETDVGFPERVEEQAKYFGVTTTQVQQLGSHARRFSKEKLLRRFTIRTCMQGARGRSKQERFYAFIETSEGDLAELLVANGLARVHGSEATPVGLTSPEREWQKLQRLEREAKGQKVGGWGASVGRLTARLARQPSKSGPDSFDAFFHPERLAAPAEAEVILTPSASPLPAGSGIGSTSPVAVGTFLDPNTATTSELLGIPGIGPVLASRIIAARPFKSADDLRTVKGIGPKRYGEIRPRFGP